jgi:hypothetical protein
MPSNEPSAQTQQSRDEPTAPAAQANSANPPRRGNTVNHFAVWARVVVGVVLVGSVMTGIFFAGFFAEKEDPYLFASLEGSLAPEEDNTCIQVFCVPAGRAGQHCRQVLVPC